MLGYRPDELIGQNVRLLVPEPQRSEHDSYVENYLNTGKAEIIGKGRHLNAVHKDDSAVPIWIQITDGPFNNARLFTAILHDNRDEK